MARHCRKIHQKKKMEAMVTWTIAALREMLPGDCGVSCRCREPQPDTLTTAEISRMKTAGDTRRADFIAGRSAAREALAHVGILDAEIPVGPRGEPLWPQGTVGSISHAGGIAVAAATRSDALAALGLDIELTGAVTRDVWADILRPSEMAFVNSQPEKGRDKIATALFCLKEAFYKFQYPQTHLWLEFKDVDVVLDGQTSRCRLTPRQPITIGARIITEFAGHYRIGEALTIAAVF